MTFEQVLEIFRDYLAQDAEIEIVKTSRGYLRIVWAGRLPFCDDASVCETPELMFDRLLEDCQGYHEARITKGQRELTPEDIRQAKDQCRPYIEKRRELDNTPATPD